MSWGKIAKAFENGTQVQEKPKRKYKATGITIDGETKPLISWAIDERNIHKLSYRCLHLRAERGIHTLEKFFAEDE